MSEKLSDHLDERQLADLKKAVVLVAQEAANFIQSQYAVFDNQAVEEKDLNSLVSYVDIEAEKLIVSGLKELLVHASFVTEEDTIMETHASVFTWVIDPLDGTTNFIHQLPFFSVSIALKYEETYVLGVVYDIMHDDVFSAALGQGAWLNDRSISVSSDCNLSDVVLATGFPYNSFEQMESYLSLFRVLFQSTRGLRRYGSAALDLCYVAKGSFAGFFEYGLNEWDIAAGICIVREAGGAVSDFQGQDRAVENETILATNYNIHDEMLSLIREHYHPIT